MESLGVVMVDDAKEVSNRCCWCPAPRQEIGGAVIKSDVTNTTTMSLESGVYLMILPSGTHAIGVEASGYEPPSTGCVIVNGVIDI